MRPRHRPSLDGTVDLLGLFDGRNVIPVNREALGDNMAFDRKKFRDWMARLGIWSPIIESGEGKDPIQMLILRHQKSELSRWPISRECDEERVMSIATDVEGAAQIHVDGLGGVASFGLFAYADPQEASRGQFVFKLEAYEEEKVGDIEPASVEGLVSQLMRHNEALARTLTTSMGSVMMHQSNVLRSLGSTIEGMMSKRMEEIRDHEEALSLKHEREMQAQAAKNADERLSKGMDRAMAMIPAVINRLAQDKIVPEPLSVGEMMLVSLASKMTPAQIEEMKKILTPEQLLMFGEIMTKAMDANDKAAKAAQGTP